MSKQIFAKDRITRYELGNILKSRCWDEKLREIVEIDADTKKLSDRYAYVHVKCMDDSVEYIETDYFPETIKELDSFLPLLGDSLLTGYLY